MILDDNLQFDNVILLPQLRKLNFCIIIN